MLIARYIERIMLRLTLTGSTLRAQSLEDKARMAGAIEAQITHYDYAFDIDVTYELTAE